MSQHYSDPKRASDPTALPDVETFQTKDGYDVSGLTSEEQEHLDPNAWWYWDCLPGCMPDSDPIGPFKTEAEALEDARDGMNDEEEES